MLLVVVTCFIQTENNIFFPRKRKKGYAVSTAMQRRLSRFLEKKYYPNEVQAWRFFFQNPQGLTFTDGKRNGYLCNSFFSE